MIKIGIFTPVPADSTSLYRAWGPFTALEDEHVQLTPIDLRTVRWPELAGIDILFCHRPNMPEYAGPILHAKDMGKKVWIDWDDDPFNIDRSNKAFPHFAKDEVQGAIKTMMSAADCITVTTKSIGDTFDLYAAKVQVIENEIPIHMIQGYAEDIAYNNDLIAWRGTDHHVLNIVEFKSAIEKVAKSNTNWPWVFMGFRPYPVSDAFAPIQLMEAPAMNQWEFFRYLQMLRASIHIVPMKDTKFNIGKSNIAYQEALLFGGSLCIVPNMPEWNTLSGAVIYEDVKDFESKLIQAQNMSHKARSSIVKPARRALVEKLEKKSYATRRLEIARGLLSQ
jgi:hypothetical protein